MRHFRAFFVPPAFLRKQEGGTKNGFNIAVSEIGDSTLWQKATLGIACVSGEKRNGQMLLDQVIDFLKDESRIEIVDYKIEI